MYNVPSKWVQRSVCLVLKKQQKKQHEHDVARVGSTQYAVHEHIFGGLVILEIYFCGSLVAQLVKPAPRTEAVSSPQRPGV